MRDDSPKRPVRETAARMLGARALSSAQLAAKLAERGYDETEISETVEWAVEYGFVDDAEYAGNLAEHYINRGYGKRRISQELRARLGDSDAARLALERLPDMADTIDGFIAAKIRGELDAREKNRISQALARRGFSWDEISAAWRRYGSDDSDDC